MCYNNVGSTTHHPVRVIPMNEAEFRTFLKRSRRKDSAIEQIVGIVSDYETYFQTNYPGKHIDQTTIESLEGYVSWLESETNTSASKPLWALRYYFDYLGNQELSRLCGDLRQERIKRVSFLIKKFRGMDSDTIDRLEAFDIENIDQVLEAGRTPQLRQELARLTGVPLGTILEVVKLSDLARLGAVRSVRARLYHDAGLTPETIATWEPEDLRAMLVAWVERTGFDGIAPLPKEVQHLVEASRKLPTIVVY
jgi:hypothetical protein